MRVRAGRYAPFVTASGLRPGLATFRPHGSERVLLEGLEVASGRVAFEGFDFLGSAKLLPGAKDVALRDNRFPDASIVLDEGSARVLIEGNRISHPRGYGIIFSAGSTDPTIDDVSIVRNRIDGIADDAIQAKRFTNLLVDGNEILNIKRLDLTSHPDAFQSYLGGSGLVFRNNFVHASEGGVIVKDGRVTNMVIENNVFVDMPTDATAVNVYNAPGARIVNNTVWGAGGLMLRSGTTNAVVANNVLNVFADDGLATYAYQGHNLAPRGNRAGRGTGDIVGRPVFQDLAGKDLSLAPGSPGIDAGLGDGIPSLDARGRARVDDPLVANTGSGALGFVDIGAFEHHPAGAPEPPPTDPPPTEPPPTDPPPTEPPPTEPPPTDPPPTDPPPTDPPPTDPPPTDPPPTDPPPTDPVVTDPLPTNPLPTEPAPTEPVPTEPAPTEPAPTEPVPTEPPPPTVDPGLKLKAPKRQRVGTKALLPVTATCTVDCQVALSVELSIDGQRARAAASRPVTVVAPATFNLEGGKPVRLSLDLSRPAVERLARRMRKGEKVVATVALLARTDSALGAPIVEPVELVGPRPPRSRARR